MMDKITTIPRTPMIASQDRTAQTASPALKAEKAPKRSEGAEDSSAAFSAAMMMAGQAAAPQQAQVPATEQKSTEAQTVPNGTMQAPKSEVATTRVKSSTDNVNMVAANLMQAKAASSPGTNAGAMIAGLQPRLSTGANPAASQPTAMLEGARSMKEWVFDGVEGNPNLKSLFDSQLGVGQKAGENLLKEVQSKQQVRGEMANEAEAGAQSQPVSSFAQPMTSAQGEAMLHDGKLGEISASVERSQQNVVRPTGSSTLSGGEFLSTLSSLKAGQNQAFNSGSGAGSSGKEDAKAGVKSGVTLEGLKKSKSALNGDASFDSSTLTGGLSGSAQLNSARTDFTGKPAQVNSNNTMQAQVTTGSMAQDRIASASLAGLSSNIRNLTLQGQGGGEMRVKLHPENLGELHLRVVTDGSQVSLQINASDEKAKKILEASLSDLKDGLSKHQLNLGQVEVAVTQSQNAFSSDMGTDSRQSSNPFSSMQDMMNNSGGRSGQWAGAQEGGSARDQWNSSPLRTAVPGARAAVSQSASASQAGGVASRRLDIRA